MAFRGNESIDNFSDETFDLLCTMCKRKHRNCEADKYCVDCHDYYCVTCVKVHEDVPSLNWHTILDKSQFPSGSSQKLPMAPTERCDKHSHKHVDMYCQNHDEVGCSTCIAVDHRSCKDTFYIPEFIQNNASPSAADAIKRKLDSVANFLTEQQDTLRKENQKLLSNRSETLSYIRKFRKEINDKLDEMEKKSIDEVESICKALISEIEKAIALIQTSKLTVQSARDKLASTCDNVSQVFVNAKKGNKIANIALNCTEETKTQIPLVHVDFTVNQKLSCLLAQVNKFGEITQINRKNEDSSDSNSKDQQITPSQSTKQNNPAVSGSVQQKNVLLKGFQQKNYTVEVKSDKYVCDIISACVLDDGTIILSDHNNSKLKRLDSSSEYTVRDYCNLPCKPWQVCSMSKQEVAVCLSCEQVVQFISVGSRMKKSREIKTDFRCCGLAYAFNNLYISDSWASIYTYNISTNKLKQLSLDQTGHRLFSNICSLAVSQDGSRIYVADRDSGLIVLDNNGQVVGQFNGPQIETALGCYPTDTGSVLVCGYNSYNVLQFGSNGELMGEVVKSDKYNRYQAVCYNQQMSKLIVGSKSDEIEVYDLV